MIITFIMEPFEYLMEREHLCVDILVEYEIEVEAISFEF